MSYFTDILNETWSNKVALKKKNYKAVQISLYIMI